MDINLKGRLKHIESEIGNSYDIYDDHFLNNTLTYLGPNVILATSKADLQSLYKYSSKVFRIFRGQVAALQPQSIRYTCQYCTVSPNQTIDHYLPKEEFPEFSVHAINLVPCCSKCNGYKADIWKEGETRLFINFYKDILPDAQYLFVEISEDANNEIDFRFNLRNCSNIPQPEFDLIYSHFTRLRLFRRMELAAIGVVSELKNSILAGVERASLADVIQTVVSTAERNKVSYGSNYWKAILEIALVESDVFLKHVFL